MRRRASGNAPDGHPPGPSRLARWFIPRCPAARRPCTGYVALLATVIRGPSGSGRQAPSGSFRTARLLGNLLSSICSETLEPERLPARPSRHPFAQAFAANEHEAIHGEKTFASGKLDVLAFEGVDALVEQGEQVVGATRTEHAN